MFDKIGRSWEFAKISYGLLWDFKQLIIFPLLSTIAVTSAADVIFKALLFNYATDRSVPQGIDSSSFASAFGPRD